MLTSANILSKPERANGGTSAPVNPTDVINNPIRQIRGEAGAPKGWATLSVDFPPPPPLLSSTPISLHIRQWTCVECVHAWLYLHTHEGLHAGFDSSWRKTLTKDGGRRRQPARTKPDKLVLQHRVASQESRLPARTRPLGTPQLAPGTRYLPKGAPPPNFPQRKVPSIRIPQGNAVAKKRLLASMLRNIATLWLQFRICLLTNAFSCLLT